MYWSQSTKITFRFFFCYITLFTISNQFVLITGLIDPIWQKIVPWFSTNILGRASEISLAPSGSGDTTYNWISLLCYIVTSLLVTLIWSIIHRHRSNYNRLLIYLTILIRYYLILQMVSYGFAKVFYSQFQPERLSRLIQPYGDSSPMGLLWTFMGHSQGYNIFAGGGELLGGLLLLFRRTRTLGALVTFAVMVNVMMLNYFYDVPVKILSTHIVLMALFLISLDLKRLYKLFILNQPTASKSLPDFTDNPNLIKVKNMLKWVLVIGYLGYGAYTTLEVKKEWGHTAPKPPLHGLYDVETFIQNGDTLPPLLTDRDRWRRLMVERNDYGIVYPMEGQKKWKTFKTDTANNIIQFYGIGDTLNIDTLYYSKSDSSYLKLNGILQGDTMEMILKKKRREDFLLVNRGFHWVNEYPFNR